MNVFSAKLAKLHDAHLTIGAAVFSLLFLVVLARLGGVARDMLLASRFGTGAVADAYLFATTLITWPISVWFGALNVVLVPALARLQGKRVPVHHNLLVLSLAIGVVLGLVAWLALPILARAPQIGLTPLAADITSQIAPALSLLLPLGFIVALYSVWVMGLGGHANTLFEGIPPLTVAFALLVITSADAQPLIWSTVLGSALQLGALVVYVGPWQGSANLSTHSDGVRIQFLWRSFAFVMIGQALSTTTIVVDQIMAAPLGAGAVAILGYANRIMLLMTGLASLVITRAVLATISNLHARKDPLATRIILQWAALFFSLAALVSFLGYWLAPFLVQLLFQGGAFTADDSAIVTRVLRAGLAQLPFFCVGIVLAAQLAATMRYWVFAATGALNLVLKTAANSILIPQFGIAGITFGSVIMYAGSAVLALAIITTLKSVHSVPGKRGPIAKQRSGGR